MEGPVGLPKALDLERGLERLDLGAEPVALDSDGDAAEEFLAALLRALDPAREEDRAGAGAPDWLRFEELAHGLKQACEAREEGDCR